MKEYNLKINGNEYTVAIEINGENSAEAVVNGTAYHVTLEDTKIKKAVVSKPQVAAVPASHPVPNLASPTKSVAPAGGGNSIQSPLPGVILSLNVAVGDTVAAGDTVAILEAMKMENNVDSPYSGVVKAIKVNQGDSVLEGDVILTIE